MGSCEQRVPLTTALFKKIADQMPATMFQELVDVLQFDPQRSGAVQEADSDNITNIRKLLIYWRKNNVPWADQADCLAEVNQNLAAVVRREMQEEERRLNPPRKNNAEANQVGSISCVNKGILAGGAGSEAYMEYAAGGREDAPLHPKPVLLDNYMKVSRQFPSFVDYGGNLECLREKVQQDQFVLVTGLPGSGKKRLALEYASGELRKSKTTRVFEIAMHGAESFCLRLRDILQDIIKGFPRGLFNPPRRHRVDADDKEVLHEAMELLNTCMAALNQATFAGITKIFIFKDVGTDLESVVEKNLWPCFEKMADTESWFWIITAPFCQATEFVLNTSITPKPVATDNIDKVFQKYKDKLGPNWAHERGCLVEVVEKYEGLAGSVFNLSTTLLRGGGESAFDTLQKLKEKSLVPEQAMRDYVAQSCRRFPDMGRLSEHLWGLLVVCGPGDVPVDLLRYAFPEDRWGDEKKFTLALQDFNLANVEVKTHENPGIVTVGPLMHQTLKEIFGKPTDTSVQCVIESLAVACQRVVGKGGAYATKLSSRLMPCLKRAVAVAQSDEHRSALNENLGLRLLLAYLVDYKAYIQVEDNDEDGALTTLAESLEILQPCLDSMTGRGPHRPEWIDGVIRVLTHQLAVNPPQKKPEFGDHRLCYPPEDVAEWLHRELHISILYTKGRALWKKWRNGHDGQSVSEAKSREACAKMREACERAHQEFPGMPKTSYELLVDRSVLFMFERGAAAVPKFEEVIDSEEPCYQLGRLIMVPFKDPVHREFCSREIVSNCSRHIRSLPVNERKIDNMQESGKKYCKELLTLAMSRGERSSKIGEAYIEVGNFHRQNPGHCSAATEVDYNTGFKTLRDDGHLYHLGRAIRSVCDHHWDLHAVPSRALLLQIKEHLDELKRNFGEKFVPDYLLHAQRSWAQLYAVSLVPDHGSLQEHFRPELGSLVRRADDGPVSEELDKIFESVGIVFKENEGQTYSRIILRLEQLALANTAN